MVVREGCILFINFYRYQLSVAGYKYRYNCVSALLFWMRVSKFTIMKKLLLIAGVLFTLTALVESCAPSRGIPRPQRHPTPPKKFVMVQNTVDNSRA